MENFPAVQSNHVSSMLAHEGTIVTVVFEREYLQKGDLEMTFMERIVH